MKKHIIIIWVLFSVVCLAGTAFGAIIVGRIAHVEGQIYRYMDVDQSWVETFAESPAGTQDVLATGAGSRVEIAFPNNVLLRLDENAEMEIRNMEEDISLFALQAGLARFYNRSGSGALAVETIMGTVKVGPGTAVDVFVDGDSVVIAALHGTATFQSLINDMEKLEVISGSTSLEFHGDSIIAGIGPIDRNWDMWCVDRENVWAQTRVVRSAYLPETMQEYAYVLEPNGSWRRIYYRGYYYWAWQPRNVALGWAPYTTGMWYDWQGAPVWVDHNPWGWVTHHHGHWIQMQGAWMWTPYVHVSNVPGVTVVGLNIAFGRTYRPHWHPGRVRWISYSSYVGWLPLAPWETYYGYRSWGPRSIVVQDGANLSISINLANHRYVDHAVIIPGHDFHRRGPLAINNYNTVKIKNIDRRKLATNYKPIPMVGKQKHEKQGRPGTRTASQDKRPAIRPERRTERIKETATIQKRTRKESNLYQAQKTEPQEKAIYKGRQASKGREAATKEQNKKIKHRAKIEKRVFVSAQNTKVGKSESQEITAPGRSISARTKVKRSRRTETKNRAAEEIRPAVSQAVSRIKARPRNINVAAGQKSPEVKKQEQPGMTQRQVQPDKGSNRRTEKEIRGNYAANEKKPEPKQERQIAGELQYNGLHNTSRESKGSRQRAGRDLVSASENNRSLR